MMIPKIIGIVFGILAVWIYAWKFKENGDNLFCFSFGKTICGAQFLDEIEFVHGVPFFGNCS